MTARITTAAVLMCASVATAQSLVLEPVAVKDPMAGGKVAMTFLKPKGWNASGGVKWYPDAAHQACFEIKLTNPNGLEQIETLPWCYACWFSNPVIPMQRGTNYLGSLVETPMEPKDVVKNLTIPVARRGARIIDVQDMSDVAKQFSKLMGGAKIVSQRVRIEYTVGGEAVEEDIYLSLFYTSANLGVNNCIAYNWGPVFTPFALRAAKGKLDAMTSLMMPVISSSKINPKWYDEYLEVCGLFMNRMKISIQGAAEVSKTITRNSNEIFNMISQSYWNRQASQDRTNQNFSDATRGVQRYNSPHETYPVQLPGGYKYAWTNSSGQYVLSNDANFDPNVGSTLNWSLLKEAR